MASLLIYFCNFFFSRKNEKTKNKIIRPVCSCWNCAEVRRPAQSVSRTLLGIQGQGAGALGPPVQTKETRGKRQTTIFTQFCYEHSSLRRSRSTPTMAVCGALHTHFQTPHPAKCQRPLHPHPSPTAEGPPTVPPRCPPKPPHAPPRTPAPSEITGPSSSFMLGGISMDGGSLWSWTRPPSSDHEPPVCFTLFLQKAGLHEAGSSLPLCVQLMCRNDV